MKERNNNRKKERKEKKNEEKEKVNLNYKSDSEKGNDYEAILLSNCNSIFRKFHEEEN